MHYAKQVPYEYQESFIERWGFKGTIYGDVAVTGNRDFEGYKPEVFENVEEVYEHGELEEAIEDMLEFGSTNYLPYANTIADVVQDFLPPYKFDGDSCDYKRDRERKYTWQEINTIAYFMFNYKRDDGLLRVLSIVTDEEWDTTTIRGCCQSDWQDLYYPVARWGRELINALETEYFNTGTEWIVHDKDTDVEDANDVIGYSTYVIGYDYKKELAESIGCSEDDLTIFEYNGMTSVPTWKTAS